MLWFAASLALAHLVILQMSVNDVLVRGIYDIGQSRWIAEAVEGRQVQMRRAICIS